MQVHVGVVNGRYLVNVTLVGYTNPNQRCADCGSNRCCDTNFDSNNCFRGRRCDTFFFFCLRPFGSTGTGCSYNGDLTSEVNEDDAAINFNQMKFLGLDNPLTLEGLTDAWNVSWTACRYYVLHPIDNSLNLYTQSVQIYIEARDQDENGQYQLIDFWRINDDLPVGVQSRTQEFTGEHNIMRLTTRRITVLCAQNFTGSDCTQCVSGLTGSQCDININNDCKEETCSGNGRCIDGLNSFTCNCNSGYTGTICEEIDNCVNETCSGHGICMDGLNSFTCICDPGFTGKNCEDNIDECADRGVNCSGNGQCVDGISSYSCNCSAGYNGTDCEINIDDCSPNPCGANGQCIDGVDSFTCNCATGYTGTLCDRDIDECLSNPCGTNGQCENQAGSFNCSCNPGFTGDLCLTDIDDCVGINCSGNGVCLDGVNSFTCQCSPGYSGTLCADGMILEASVSNYNHNNIIMHVISFEFLFTRYQTHSYQKFKAVVSKLVPLWEVYWVFSYPLSSSLLLRLLWSSL